MTGSWRCFVAVPVGDDLRTKLAFAVEEWRRRPDLSGLRWLDPDSWHLTLAFMGAVAAADVPRLAAALDATGRGHEGSELRTGDLGGFPTAAHARVAWCGVADPSGRLRRLASDVRQALALSDAEPFRGHVTIARARSAPVDLRQWVASARAPDATLAADRVELMRTHLGRGPASYEVLASIPLGVAAGV